MTLQRAPQPLQNPLDHKVYEPGKRPPVAEVAPIEGLPVASGDSVVVGCKSKDEEGEEGLGLGAHLVAPLEGPTRSWYSP